MAEDTQPIESDEVLQTEAQRRLAQTPTARLLARLLAQLRTRPHPWWSGVNLRRSWPTATRFEWLAARPDVRGRLTHELTGLPLTAARILERPMQVQLIDNVVETGAKSPEDWDRAFSPEELALHAPAHVLWSEFRSRFPWEAPRVEDVQLLQWLIADLVQPHGGDAALLTPLYVRLAVDLRVWQDHLPVAVRVQVDGMRLRRELEGKPFTAEHELAIVKVERLVQFITPKHLRPVLDAVERVLPELAGEPPELDPSEIEPVEDN